MDRNSNARRVGQHKVHSFLATINFFQLSYEEDDELTMNTETKTPYPVIDAELPGIKVNKMEQTETSYNKMCTDMKNETEESTWVQ